MLYINWVIYSHEYIFDFFNLTNIYIILLKLRPIEEKKKKKKT
jgi:hypothetical protein